MKGCKRSQDEVPSSGRLLFPANRQVLAKVPGDAAFDTFLYDTGWKEELDSLGTDVPPELEPLSRYYWKVFVKSDAGEEAVSETAWFETGKMDQSWQADWITCRKEEKRHPQFEKEIRLSRDGDGQVKELERARLYICGPGLYEAFLDGKRHEQHESLRLRLHRGVDVPPCGRAAVYGKHGVVMVR